MRNKKIMWIYILNAILISLGIFTGIQGIQCNQAVKESKKRLETYNPQTFVSSFGKMTYVDKGEGTAILSVHGIFGGYDQAYDTCKDFQNELRIIAPSRFGYLGSENQQNATLHDQATAYAELLENLNIDKVYVLATSAGGSVAIRFALDYPERTKGLILYCSAMPLTQQPEKIMKYAGPPGFLCNNFSMFLMRPFFRPMMGMEPSTIYSMLPVNQRKKGVVFDSSVTNLDMAKNFDDYPIEKLQCPTLILHAKDDKLANYNDVENVLYRFPNCTFISFEDGGHLMVGHEEEVYNSVITFVQNSNIAN